MRREKRFTGVEESVYLLDVEFKILSIDMDQVPLFLQPSSEVSHSI